MPAFMRYGDGGGVNQAGRARREQIRRRAAAMFAEGMPAPEVAAVLEVSTKAAYAWRRDWLAGGVQALASKGPPGPQPTLLQAQVDRLERRLKRGPVRPCCLIRAMRPGRARGGRGGLSGCVAGALRVPKTVSVQVTPHVRTHEGRRPDDHADGCRDG
jgi:hypothetical protein